MMELHRRSPEIYCQLEGGQRGDKLCPSYRGTFYRQEIERLADQTAKVKADLLSCDIELFGGVGTYAQKCSRCRADFQTSGCADGSEWCLRKGEEMWTDLSAAVRSRPGMSGIDLGGYDFRPGANYQNIWPVDRLYPKHRQNTQVSTYTPLYPYHPELIGNEVRTDRAKLPKSDILPWLTPGDAGVFPGEMFRYAVLECFANGARGLHFWSGRLWDTELLTAYARVIRNVAPVEDIIVDGELLTGAAAEPAARVSGMRRGNLMFLLVAAYWKSSGTKTVKVTVPYVALRDGTFTFYNQVAKGLAKIYPDKLLGTYAYATYRDVPLGVRPHPNLLVGFVGMAYWDDEQLEGDRQRWEQWAAVARNLFLRPNAFHQGHGMPGVFVTKLDRDIKRCYQTGMIAADFDSVLHHWATQGLNYYVLAKLLWDPSQDAEAIVQDYCRKGFGPAGHVIRRYFRELEEVTDRCAGGSLDKGNTAGELRDEEEEPAGKHSETYRRPAQTYTPAVIGQLRRTLAEARAAAGDQERVKQRIDFLEAGLCYGELQAAVHGAFLAKQADKASLHRLLDERYTVFRQIVRTQPKLPSVTEMTAEGWSGFVDGFDVQVSADPMAEGQVGWVLFCLDDHYFDWPFDPQTGLLKDFGIAPLKRIARAVKGDAPPHDTHILYDNLKEK